MAEATNELLREVLKPGQASLTVAGGHSRNGMDRRFTRIERRPHFVEEPVN
jgi:hypothetical protein